MKSSKIKKRSLLFYALLVLSSCTNKANVKDIEEGKNLAVAVKCSSVKAVESFFMHPYYVNKMNAHFNKILYESTSDIYWGYVKCNMSDYYVDTLFVTPKKAYENIVQKIHHLDKNKSIRLISAWLQAHPPMTVSDTIKKIVSIESMEIMEEKQKYMVKIKGKYEYYYNKMEASPDPHIDSVYQHYTIENYRFETCIEEGKHISQLVILE